MTSSSRKFGPGFGSKLGGIKLLPFPHVVAAAGVTGGMSL